MAMASSDVREVVGLSHTKEWDQLFPAQERRIRRIYIHVDGHGHGMGMDEGRSNPKEANGDKQDTSQAMEGNTGRCGPHEGCIGTIGQCWQCTLDKVDEECCICATAGDTNIDAKPLEQGAHPNAT